MQHCLLCGTGALNLNISHEQRRVPVMPREHSACCNIVQPVVTQALREELERLMKRCSNTAAFTPKTHSAEKQQKHWVHLQRGAFEAVFQSVRHFVMMVPPQGCCWEYRTQPDDKGVRVSVRELMGCASLHYLLEYCRRVFNLKVLQTLPESLSNTYSCT